MKILVRAVPSERMECVKYIQNKIPQAELFYDTARNAMDTFLRALQYVKDDAAIHMEEDIFVTRDIMAKMHHAIKQRPDTVVQFFSMRQADLTIGSRYDNNFCMAQCFYLPPGYSRMVFEYYSLWPRKHTTPTALDYLVNDYLRMRKEKYWIHVPSLVQHRSIKSIINPKRSSKRQSLTFTDPA